jgi:hypothetical protein
MIYSFWREHIVGKYCLSHSVSAVVGNGGGGMNEWMKFITSGKEDSPHRARCVRHAYLAPENAVVGVEGAPM